MKWYIFFIALTLLFVQCDGDSNDISDHDLVTTTFKFVDYDTNQPLEGVVLNFYYNSSPGGIDIPAQRISDSKGEIKWEHQRGSILNEYKWNAHTREGHKAVKCHENDMLNPISLRESIIMYQPAYIKFHVVNEEPVHENDIIFIKHAYDACGARFSTNFKGSNVDTVYIGETTPFNPAFINYSVQGPNQKKDTIPINIRTQDTSFVEINY